MPTKQKEVAPVDYSKLTPEELIALLNAKDQEIKDSETFIVDLKEELAAKEDEILAISPLVKVGKHSYEIVIPQFNLYDKESQEITRYTASDVQKDAELAEKLVKMGSGVLVKVEKK